MRLIDADKLNRKDVNCANVPMNFIDTAPTVEAIPKDQYEARLKTDMVAVFEELKAEIEELDTLNNNDAYMTCSDIIQQKINFLKGDTNDGKNNI